MTRINTNVASLRGLRTLGRANSLLDTSLTRLSTGLKINAGKDNPAGLVASETLRSQITTIEQSVRNSNRANNVLSTADSALGEISGLLNQVRGLVQEGLNAGALSRSEIEANQLQIDNALSAINRISANTTFAGDKLIDGSRSFVTSLSSADAAKLSDFKINEAILGSDSTVSISARVTAAATKAELRYSGGALTAETLIEIGGSEGRQVLSFGASSTVSDIATAINSVTNATGVSATISTAAGSVAATGSATTANAVPAVAASRQIGGTIPAVAASQTFSSNGVGTFTVTADTAGAAGNNFSVEFVAGSGNNVALGAAFDGTDPNKIVVTLGTDGTGALDDTVNTIDAIATAIDALAGVSASDDGGAGSIDAAAAAVNLQNGADATTTGAGSLTVTADTAGSAGNDFSVEFVQAAGANDNLSVAFDGTDPNKIVVTLGNSGGALDATKNTLSAIATAIDGLAGVSATSSGSGSIIAAAAAQNLQNGADALAAESVTFTAVTAGAAGNNISVTLASGASNGVTVNDSDPNNITIAVTLAAGATSADLVNFLTNDASAGAQAARGYITASGGGTRAVANFGTTDLASGADGPQNLRLTSTGYGSSQAVEVNVLQGTFATTLADGTTAAARDTGTDIAVNVNGQQATGKGLAASVKTASLDVSVTFAEASNVASTSATIQVNGGGATFQIGQEASVLGQISVGIEAVNTARLGGVSGKLYELGSGGGKSLLDVGNGVQGSELVAVIEEALNSVNTVRGRIGALQKNVIETNISTLGVALENISEARSEIVDADFAVESANLTKGQILSQAGISVLSIANQNPQQVLSLLR